MLIYIYLYILTHICVPICMCVMHWMHLSVTGETISKWEGWQLAAHTHSEILLSVWKWLLMRPHMGKG